MAPPALAGSCDLPTRQSGAFLLPASETISAVGERALIERIRSRAGAPPAWVRLGIGDDAAVIAPDRGALQVITTDGLVEGVHFDMAWTDPSAIGHKAVAITLSDLAAMGAEPRGVLLNLSLPESLLLTAFDALIDGVVAAAAGARASLIGGNLARSPGPIVIDGTAFGSVGPRRVLTRSGGRAGDELYVTGTVGAAGAGLLAFRRTAGERARLDAAIQDCIRRYERPDARIRCGVVVARSRCAGAAIDLSDGLANGARLIAEASGTGVVLDAASIPVHPGVAAVTGMSGGDPLSLALNSGEDYELLFAVPSKRRLAFLAAVGHSGGLPITLVGRLTAEAGYWVERAGVRQPLGHGYQHFQAGAAASPHLPPQPSGRGNHS